jgi:glycerol-3-phosphate dehydrogenase
MLERLRDETFDVLVIGGGITGVGVALDAASRGLRTALVERDDFASGTSSKSSKLVHGGLRYLQSGDVRLVYEALRERQRLLRNAPHLVEVLPFMIPVLTRDGVISKGRQGAGLGDVDVRRHRRVADRQATSQARTPKRRFARARPCPRERLAGAYLYYDAAADDARLTLAVARTAARTGASSPTGAAVVGLTRDARGHGRRRRGRHGRPASSRCVPAWS